MTKEILVYETDKDVLKFLRTFFREKKEYSVRFIHKNEGALKKAIVRKQPDALDPQQSGRPQARQTL